MSKRLLKERAKLESDMPGYVTGIDLRNDDIYYWNCYLNGPIGSPYENGKFVLSLQFPTTYPFKPPKLVFATKIYHPAIQLETGEVCSDVLGSWGPTLNVLHCLKVIYSLLQNPVSAVDHPLEEEIAQQIIHKPKEFEKTAKKYTKDYAK